MISSPLFIIVAESIDIFSPIFSSGALELLLGSCLSSPLECNHERVHQSSKYKAVVIHYGFKDLKYGIVLRSTGSNLAFDLFSFLINISPEEINTLIG